MNKICVSFFRGALMVMALTVALNAGAQSKTTNRLEERFPESRAFYFYYNTLRMINQSEDPAFDAAIKDIEKMKLLMVDLRQGNVDFRKIVSEYQAEAFEPIMTSRHKGRNFDIFLKEQNGKTTAMLALVNDDQTLFVLDIVGRIDPGQVVKLFGVMDEKSEISGKIRTFVHREGDEEKNGHQVDE
ncbi:MAG: DUF4252 domain-containing protein [Bacteroidota bacterium]